MRIAFNTLHENPHAPSNAVRFIGNLVMALAERAPENEYLLYVGSQALPLYAHVDAPCVSRRVFRHGNERRVRRIVAEQTVLPSLLKTDRVDVFHCIGGVVPLRSSVASILSVITMHHKFFPKEIGYLRSGFRQVMFNLSVRKATLVSVNSQSNLVDIRRFLPVDEEKIVLVPDALDRMYLEAPAPGHPEQVLASMGIRQPYIIFASALYRYKNLETLLDAFGMLRDEGSPVKQLVVAGHGPERYVTELRRRAAAAGVEDVTLFVGHQSAEDLRSLYAAAAACVYPSLYETFGHPPLQAMAQGTPVIASNCSSIPEVVGDAALVVDPSSPRELCDALHKILSDGRLRAQLVERGRRRAEFYSWDGTARAVLKAYDRLAVERQHQR